MVGSDGGGSNDWRDQARTPRLDEESPIRRRARLRAERAAQGRRRAAMSLLWIAAGALVIPMVLVFGGFFIRRAIGQGAPQPPDPFQIITSTPPPRLIVTRPTDAWLSATPPAVSTFAPGFFAGLFGSRFASATPGFSLATSSIVYVCYVDQSDEICLMNADGTRIRQLTRESKYTDWYPSFTPDGQHILFSSQRGGHFDIYIMDTNGENVQQVTRGIGDCYAPSMSRIRQRIVFTSTESGAQNIWAINLDGTALQRLTVDTRDNVDPVWSPDGSRVSFTSTDRGQGDLMIVNADGSNSRRVTHGINVEGRNSWSPDGKYLAFYAGPVGDKDIYIVETGCASLPNGCGPAQMRKLTAGGNNKAPDFSPDGQWVAFTSELAGHNEVWIIRVDGSEFYQVTFNGVTNWQPRWGPWNP